MLRFTDTEQHYPPTRAAEARTQDFAEISEKFDPIAAAEQAARCSQCGIPFCQIHCPLQNNIPDWLKLAAEGRLAEAYALSSATNNFPEICGRICPQDRLCEGNCVIERGFGAVTIGAVEKHITETAFAEGWVKPIRVGRESGKSVGIIGAGPAGLAAAEMLRREGHAVMVYDAHDRIGGLLIYGIPNFKLDKSIVARRERLLRESSIRFTLRCRIGLDLTLAELRARHDAVLIATGVYQARRTGIAGEKLAGIVPAMTYLTTSNRRGLGDRLPADAPDAKDRRVVVIGGGDTAMDCVRTAVRQGAHAVTCLYRRDRASMPGSAREVAHAEAEGIQFAWLSAPEAFLGQTRIEAVRVAAMQLGEADASGRRAITPTGEHHTLPADLVIEALGFDPEPLPGLWGEPQLTTTRHGTLAVNAQYETSLAGVYAAGDMVRGASLVVWAIKDGREAAAAIHRALTSKEKRA